MQIRRRAFGVEILAPAKVNLFFEVLSRRDDGFHEIETLMVPVSLYDTLILEDDPSGQVTIAPRWSAGLADAKIAATRNTAQRNDSSASNLDELPKGESNIAVRAVRLLAEKTGINRGAKLQLIKRIPSMAGLGGGSSDAAAALVAANLVWNLGWTRSRLADIAAELGSDVPFFLGEGPAVCRGRGEKIDRVAGLGVLHLVLVRPPEGLATAAVYRACSPGNPPQQINPVIDTMRRNNLAGIGPVAHNRLLPAARQLSPWVNQVLDRLTQENCPAIGMSGSGTTCFAVCRSAPQARQVAARLRTSEGAATWVQPARTL